MDAVELLSRGQPTDYTDTDIDMARHNGDTPDDKELRRISENELSNSLEEAAERGARKFAGHVLAVIDVDINKAEEVRKLRDAIFFLYASKAAADAARRRFWVTLSAMLFVAMIAGAAQAIWDLVKAKIH